MTTVPPRRADYWLIEYGNDAGEREIIWNSRRGGAPESTGSAVTGEAITPRAWLRYAPEHVPAVGDRVIVDVTEVRARVVAEARFAIASAEELDVLSRRFESRADAMDSAVSYMVAHRMPDILTVTSGYITELLELRKRGLFAEPEQPLAERARPRDDGGPHLFFDRDGQPITLERYSELFRDRNYRVIDHTHIRPDLHVSTIWLGIDHSFERNALPVIFETMVFRGVGVDDAIWEDRHHTEEHARLAHRLTCTAAEEIEARVLRERAAESAEAPPKDSN